MRFKRFRRFLNRSKPVGIAFSAGRISLFSSWLQHSVSCDSDEPESLLVALTRELKLDCVDCAVSLPLSRCGLTTVTLPRCSSAELRQIMSQPLFWQEYLNADLREYRVWWRRIRCSDADKTQVLVAVAPVKVLECYKESARSAGFASCRIGISCFDFIAAAKPQSRPCCFVVVGAVESFIVSFGDLGIRTSSMASDMQPEQLGAEISRLMKDENIAETRVQVTVITDTPGAYPTPAGMSEFMPKNFLLEVVPVQQFAGVSADDCAGIAHAALRYRHARRYADFSMDADTMSDSNRMIPLKKLKPMLIGGGLLALGAQGYVHWMLSQEHQQLSLQIAGHGALEQVYQQSREDAAALNDAINRQSAVLDDIAELELSDSVSIRVLEMIEQAASHGIWLSRTEFRMSSLLHIEGKAIDNESIVHYSNALRQYDAIAEVRIRNLGRQPGDELVSFFLECSLNVSFHLTDA